MDKRGHNLRFAAVAVLVMLALTGFSSGPLSGSGKSGSAKSKGSSRSSGGSGGGGGCSSSSQDHDSSSSSGGSGSRHHDYDYDDDDAATGDTYDDSGSSATSTTTLRDAEAEAVSCASAKTPYATVKVTNPNAVAGTFTMTGAFYDDDEVIELWSEEVDVPAGGTVKVKVNLKKASLATKVDDCWADLYAPPVR